MRTFLRWMLPCAVAISTVGIGEAAGQNIRSRYETAAQLLGPNARRLVSGDEVRPVWLADGDFWFRSNTGAGRMFVRVDPTARTRQPAFDHVRLAAALSLAAPRIRTEIERFPSTTIGAVEVIPIQLAEAYTVFANGGVIRPLKAITQLVENGTAREIKSEEARRVARADTTLTDLGQLGTLLTAWAETLRPATTPMSPFISG